MTLNAPAAAARPPRKQDRAARRTQLIEATIEVLADQGFARATLTEVARRAGLSHGLVNFHFASKQGLLSETLRYLVEEHRENWTAAFAAAAPDDPAAQLRAMLLADFDPRICTPVRLAAWCAYWGEAPSRPMFEQHYAEVQEDYIRVLEDVCARLLAHGGYAGDAARVARVLRVGIEGLWIDLITLRHPYDREEAAQTVLTCAAAFFPRHFGGPAGRGHAPGAVG